MPCRGRGADRQAGLLSTHDPTFPPGIRQEQHEILDHLGIEPGTRPCPKSCHSSDPNPLRPDTSPARIAGLDVPGVARAFVYEDFVKK